MYWGEMNYETPGCGKTCVANKYQNVVDGNDLIVEAILEIDPYCNLGYYSDPRKAIFQYFRYTHSTELPCGKFTTLPKTKFSLVQWI